MSTILFVDDDKDILSVHASYFKKQGHTVACASNAQAALQLLSTAALDCVVLDIDMPGEDGFSVCRKLREKSGLPVIFLSGLTEEEVRVKSFLVGGDDYLGKPYHIKELEVRINARIQSPRFHTEMDTLHFGPLTISMELRTVTYMDQPGDFTTLQFDVLAFLAKHPNQVFTYEQIYDRVWKVPLMGSKHNLQVIIAMVRQKLAVLCEGKRYIETVQRKGYRFVEQPACDPQE